MAAELKHIIESLLFVSDGPLTVDAIRNVLPRAEPAEIRRALAELQDDFEARGGGFHLRPVAGGFQFRTRPEYTEYVKLLLKPSPARFSKAALETLAIIAYKQPIIRADLEHIRGVDSGGVIRMLLDRKLVRILGRKEIPGRPLIYATSRHFLEVFGLRDLKDLPTPAEIEASGEGLAGRMDRTFPTAAARAGLEAPETQEPLPFETESDASAAPEQPQTAGPAPEPVDAGQADSPEPETTAEPQSHGPVTVTDTDTDTAALPSPAHHPSAEAPSAEGPPPEPDTPSLTDPPKAAESSSDPANPQPQPD